MTEISPSLQFVNAYAVKTAPALWKMQVASCFSCASGFSSMTFWFHILLEALALHAETKYNYLFGTA